jgi:hypothetical protein
MAVALHGLPMEQATWGKRWLQLYTRHDEAWGEWLAETYADRDFNSFLTMIDQFEVLYRMPWRRTGPNDVPAVFTGSLSKIFWGSGSGA